ncbi:HIT domain-containing protein [Glaciecola petra]|uniref:HIT domain-containing protein n=1 Tax=Glaciecola petra TaxID=3075602 RepID=A0ABU2ZQ06_9ALTE|nr:HIT domain-containing protein [Aestuariibacter sp. P117]MDT0594143.1 HIT domain-containing protein [Aestuariibacter sp. P117]
MSFEIDHRLKSDSTLLVKCNHIQIRLIHDSRYPWLILVPEYKDVYDVDDLDWNVQLQVLQISAWVCKALKVAFMPDKLNVAALGNIVKQLHIHHVARFEYDDTWPGPIWGKGKSLPYSPPDFEKRKGLICTTLKELNQGDLNAYYYD